MSRSVVNYLRRFRPAIAQQNELSAYCVVHLLIAYEMVSHKDAYYLLCLHQVRLAGSSIMFYVCPSVRPFNYYQTCEQSVLKTSEPLLTQIGRSVPWDKSTTINFGVRRSKVKVT